MFKTKYFLGALALFTIFGFGVAKAQTDEAAVRSSLYQILQELQSRVSALTQTAQVRSEEPATLMQTAYGLPYGTLGQTLYHNGSTWVATSNLTNSYPNGVSIYGLNSASTTTLTPGLLVSGGNIAQSTLSGQNVLQSTTIIGSPIFGELTGVRLHVNANGIRLGGGFQNSRPTCSSSNRGVIWYKQATSGDTLSACMLMASSTYAWKDL